MFKINRTGLLILNYIPLAALSSAIITPALPVIQKDYHLTLGQLEWVVSLFLIGYMFGQLIYGPWANIVGRVQAMRMGLIIGLIGIAIGYLGYLLPYFWILLVGRFINAIGTASGLVCAIIIINEEMNLQEAKATFAYAPMAFSLAVTLSIFLGGLITHWLGWQYTFFLLFVHNALMLYLTRYLPQNYDHRAYREGRKLSAHIKIDSKNIIKLICLSLIVGTTTCFTYVYTTSAPLIANSYFHFNPSQYGIWNLINVFGVILGALSLTRSITLWGGKKVIATSLLILTLITGSFLLIFLVNGAPTWFFFTSSIMYFATAWGYAAGSYYGTNAIANKALSSSILSFINMACAVVGVIVLGYLSFDELLDFVIVGAAFLVFALICYFWISKNKAFGIVPIKQPKSD